MHSALQIEVSSISPQTRNSEPSRRLTHFAGRRGRMRAKSDTYISRPVTPSSTIATLGSNDGSGEQRGRSGSLSPFDSNTVSSSYSRESSPVPDPLLNNVARPPIRSPIETTSSSSQIPAALLHWDRKNAFRNTLPRFNAICAPRNLHAHTISDPTFALTPTSGHSCAMSAPKPLPASTTERDTKASTAARRNSYARGSLAPEAIGAVAAGSHVRMLWAGISEVKPVECASSPCWMRKPWNDSATSTRQ